MAILMASVYSPCPFILFCKLNVPCVGNGGKFPFKRCFWNSGSSRQQTRLLPLTYLVCCQQDKGWTVLWPLHQRSRQAQDAGNASHLHLQSSLKLFPLVFFSLANGHWPWAGFRQVIYVFSSLNKWPCLKVGQMEEKSKHQFIFARLKSVVKQQN